MCAGPDQLGGPKKKTLCYTFVVFPAGEHAIGSVADEFERELQGIERRHRVKLTHPFALLDREITLEEVIAFHPDYAQLIQKFKAQPTDAGFGPRWYEAVLFCRWLGDQMGLPESDQPYESPTTLGT